MPKFILEMYREQSENLTKVNEQMENSNVFSPKCMEKYEEMICQAIYCSEDEEKLIIEHVKEDCQKVVKLWLVNVMFDNDVVTKLVLLFDCCGSKLTFFKLNRGFELRISSQN